MSRRNQRIEAAPKPVLFSEWIKQSGRNVTRAEAVQVISFLVERRIAVEREIIRQRQWKVRFWIWLTNFFTGARLVTAQEMERAVEAAFDPAAKSTDDTPPTEDVVEDATEEEDEDAVVEGAGEPEQLLEGVDGSKIRFRDKRGSRE